MYRFTKTQGLSLQNIYFSSRQLNGCASLKLCSFCKFYHWNTLLALCYLQSRQYRTTVNNIELSTYFKKRDRTRKKFAELLEVNEQSSSNKKAVVQKLNAAHLSLLVNQPDVTLDKLHKIKNYSYKNSTNRNLNSSCTVFEEYNSQQVIKEFLSSPADFKVLKNTEYTDNRTVSICEDLKESGVTDEATLIKSSTLLANLKDSDKVENNEEEIATTDQSSKKGSNKDVKKHKKGINKKKVLNSDLNKLRQNYMIEDYHQRVLAQMEVYIACQSLDRAYKFLLYITKKTTKVSNTVQCQITNMLLDAYAAEGKIDKVLQLYKLVISKSIVLTPYTYAILFEAISKIQHNKTQLDLLSKVESEMQHYNISLDDIFNKSPFRQDQRENVLKAINLIKPDYEPQYVMPDIDYTCNLLKDFSSINKPKSSAAGLFTINDLSKLVEKQIAQEDESEVLIKSVENFKHHLDNATEEYKEKMALEKSWEQAVRKAFDEKLNYLKQKENKLSHSSLILHPFLEVLDKNEYIKAIMQEIRKLGMTSDSFSMSIPILSLGLGNFIHKKFEIQVKKENGVLDKTFSAYKKYLSWYLREDNLNKECINSRIAWQTILHEMQTHGPSLDRNCSKWPKSVCLSVGKFLYKIILNDVKFCVDNNKTTPEHFTPAFFSLYRNKGKLMIEQIKPHPIISKLYKGSTVGTLVFQSTLMPTVCPPHPWISTETGGYLISKTPLIRTPIRTEYKQLQVLNSVPLKQLYPALDSLNQLGTIPWRINKPVLDIIMKVFQDGGSVKLNVPQPPSALEPIPLLNTDADKMQRTIISKARMQHNQKKAEMYSLWCDCLYKLSVAHHFRDQVFWLPHNLDFRGRVYPVPPHLNHLGSDLSRSLLIFAQKKPLGPNGLDWLKIHTVNLTGLKKRNSKDERLKFANENLDKIIDSAENPLTGEMWWASSDEPWQTLAACMEINNALKSENHEKYMSGFPIHQDGSCNGLQHYAALGRDTEGAKSVNLAPSEIPQDVYSTVVALVEKQRKIDAENGVHIARVLEGFIKRKVIKQTVMTTVYGVTRFGAKLQITRQLKDLENFPEEYIWDGSTYLVSKTFESLRTMFTSAKIIQDWFTECARTISTKFEENVQWVTPLGLPVIQPYSKHKKIFLRNKEYQQKVTIEVPDTVKQKNAFPPNFIHSMDSSHMMLTSLHCEHNSITFASVHDCFWTHACTVDVMNKICREQFVALHSEPILDDLSKFLVKTYLTSRDLSLNENLSIGNVQDIYKCFTSIPKKGDFKLKKVLSSKYFFS